MQINRDNKQKRRRVITILVIVFIITLAAVSAHLLLGRYFNKKTATTSESPSTATGSQNTGSTSNSSGPVNSSTSTTNTAETPTVDTSVTPTAPSGTFVSNHHPNLSATGAAGVITSTCSTTPGASCLIQFTSGGKTVSLPSQKADSNGNTYWTWTLQQVGATSGTWKISAVAVNGTKTSTTNDSLDLVVSQ